MINITQTKYDKNYFYSFLRPDSMGRTVVKTKVLHLGEVSARDAATLYDTILRVMTRGYLQTRSPPLPVTERQ